VKPETPAKPGTPGIGGSTVIGSGAWIRANEAGGDLGRSEALQKFDAFEVTRGRLREIDGRSSASPAAER
jgi:hypothetical protein